MIIRRTVFALACVAALGVYTPAPAQEESASDVPRTLRELLTDRTFQEANNIDLDAILVRPMRDLLGPQPSLARGSQRAEILDAPLGSLYGVIFAPVAATLVYDPNTGEYDVGEKFLPSDSAAWSQPVQITRCALVSRNEMSDGTATAFQFSEQNPEGYSLHLVIYDFDGPGRYSFDESTLSYAKYVPSSVGAMAVASRELKTDNTVVAMFDEIDGLGGTLDLREAEDGSLVGIFEFLGVGSTDYLASRDGATDRFFGSLIEGVFRTAPLTGVARRAGPPLPAIKLGGKLIAPPTPAKPSAMVLSRNEC